MNPQAFPHLNLSNRDYLVQRERFLHEELHRVDAILTWLRPCRVRVLLVVDGLDYSLGDFGLRTFVETLLETGGYVRFEITLAHIGSSAGAGMMEGDARIAERITNFKFDDPDHFAADRYDVVFLFGIDTFFSGRGPGYPSGSLSDAELQALAEFQNGGGGLFATGDHGALGRPLCHKVARARNMRLWNSTSSDPDADEVSMGGPRRNDTNRLGDADSQFEDQSDDVPQPISPRMYTARWGFLRYSYPHPLLCGPRGVIRIMPDHPHEGECVEPSDTSLNIDFTSDLGPEYPPATGPGPRPLPEIISTSTVLAGTTSSGKDPTVAHSFGGICAYDGHRADVGRVVTDATWHHFVNVNLIGDTTEPLDDPKRYGFLWSAAGQAHLEEVKVYFRNLAVWLSRPGNLSCMRNHLLWKLVYSHRVLEAVLATRQVKLAELRPKTLWLIGRHARDVLGRVAGQCERVQIVIQLIEPKWRELIPDIDPWMVIERRVEDDEVPWSDLTPALDIALGSALVAINEEFGMPSPQRAEKIDDDAIAQVARRGAETGMRMAMDSLSRTLQGVQGFTQQQAPKGKGRR